MGVYAEETAEPEASAPSQYAQETVQGSAVLHCFNWSYNTIRENLADIAAAGYTAVQTSPVQPPKNYNAAWTSVMDSSGGQWWKLYQPIDICVADGNTWLGTKAELAELCEEAETQYGIKVIVDIVANHLANIQSGGGFDNLLFRRRIGAQGMLDAVAHLGEDFVWHVGWSLGNEVETDTAGADQLYNLYDALETIGWHAVKE